MSDTAEWHGWQIPDVGAIHIGPLPQRKSVCLYVMEYPAGGGAVMRTLAFFRNEEDAASALKFLDAAVKSRHA
jgi:hypothetical protein